MNTPAPIPSSKEIFITPSLLAADFTRLAEECREIEESGADWLHLDIMDGHFVPNLTFGPPIVKALRKVSNLPFDAHLMVTNADDLVPMFLDAGANAISVHQETLPHLHRTLDSIRKGGALAGVVLNPSTPVHTLVDVLADCDYVLIMSVNPGFGGQKFIPRALDKIRALRAMIAENPAASHVVIQVDGGVAPPTVASVVEAGAKVLVAGSAVFGQPDRAKAISTLRELAGFA